jgi:hypothetical protein
MALCCRKLGVLHLSTTDVDGDEKMPQAGGAGEKKKGKVVKSLQEKLQRIVDAGHLDRNVMLYNLAAEAKEEAKRFTWASLDIQPPIGEDEVGLFKKVGEMFTKKFTAKSRKSIYFDGESPPTESYINAKIAEIMKGPDEPGRLRLLVVTLDRAGKISKAFQKAAVKSTGSTMPLFKVHKWIERLTTVENENDGYVEWFLQRIKKGAGQKSLPGRIELVNNWPDINEGVRIYVLGKMKVSPKKNKVVKPPRKPSPNQVYEVERKKILEMGDTDSETKIDRLLNLAADSPGVANYGFKDSATKMGKVKNDIRNRFLKLVAPKLVPEDLVRQVLQFGFIPDEFDDKFPRAIVDRFSALANPSKTAVGVLISVLLPPGREASELLEILSERVSKATMVEIQKRIYRQRNYAQKLDAILGKEGHTKHKKLMEIMKLEDENEGRIVLFRTKIAAELRIKEADIPKEFAKIRFLEDLEDDEDLENVAKFAVQTGYYKWILSDGKSYLNAWDGDDIESSIDKAIVEYLPPEGNEKRIALAHFDLHDTDGIEHKDTKIEAIEKEYRRLVSEKEKWSCFMKNARIILEDPDLELDAGSAVVKCADEGTLFRKEVDDLVEKMRVEKEGGRDPGKFFAQRFTGGGAGSFPIFFIEDASYLGEAISAEFGKYDDNMPTLYDTRKENEVFNGALQDALREIVEQGEVDPSTSFDLAVAAVECNCILKWQDWTNLKSRAPRLSRFKHFARTAVKRVNFLKVAKGERSSDEALYRQIVDSKFEISTEDIVYVKKPKGEELLPSLQVFRNGLLDYEKNQLERNKGDYEKRIRSALETKDKTVLAKALKNLKHTGYDVDSINYKDYQELVDEALESIDTSSFSFIATGIALGKTVEVGESHRECALDIVKNIENTNERISKVAEYFASQDLVLSGTEAEQKFLEKLFGIEAESDEFLSNVTKLRKRLVGSMSEKKRDDLVERAALSYENVQDQDGTDLGAKLKAIGKGPTSLYEYADFVLGLTDAKGKYTNDDKTARKLFKAFANRFVPHKNDEKQKKELEELLEDSGMGKDDKIQKETELTKIKMRIRGPGIAAEALQGLEKKIVLRERGEEGVSDYVEYLKKNDALQAFEKPKHLQSISKALNFKAVSDDFYRALDGKWKPKRRVAPVPVLADEVGPKSKHFAGSAVYL